MNTPANPARRYREEEPSRHDSAVQNEIDWYPESRFQALQIRLLLLQYIAFREIIDKVGERFERDLTAPMPWPQPQISFQTFLAVIAAGFEIHF